MDIAAISSATEGSRQMANNVQHSGNDAVNDQLANLLGHKPDALSAVKLDPAVLEAQVTLTNSERAQIQGLSDASQNERSIVPKKVSESKSQSRLDFQEMVKKQEAALLSLTPQQMDLLMSFTATMRRQRQATQKKLECSFCKNNGESVRWYSSHCLKDSRGYVKCPVLRAIRCYFCGATGDHAHTIKYCPDKILLDAD